MPASRSAKTVTSNTALVTQALETADDFLTVAQICDLTTLAPKAVMTALGWLRQAKAVDSLESGGSLYFFSTPESDTRLRRFDEHRKEDEPRVVRNRRPRRAQ